MTIQGLMVDAVRRVPAAFRTRALQADARAGCLHGCVAVDATLYAHRYSAVRGPQAWPPMLVTLAAKLLLVGRLPVFVFDTSEGCPVEKAHAHAQRACARARTRTKCAYLGEAVRALRGVVDAAGEAGAAAESMYMGLSPDARAAIAYAYVYLKRSRSHAPLLDACGITAADSSAARLVRILPHKRKLDGDGDGDGDGGTYTYTPTPPAPSWAQCMAALPAYALMHAAALKQCAGGPNMKLLTAFERVCAQMHIPVVYARSCEAETMCVALEHCNLAEAVMSDDSDVVALGAERMWRMHSGYSVCEVDCAQVRAHYVDGGRAEFVEFCILLGTDFNARTRGMGPRAAEAAMRAYGSLSSIVEVLRHSAVGDPEWSATLDARACAVHAGSPTQPRRATYTYTQGCGRSVVRKLARLLAMEGSARVPTVADLSDGELATVRALFMTQVAVSADIRNTIDECVQMHRAGAASWCIDSHGSSAGFVSVLADAVSSASPGSALSGEVLAQALVHAATAVGSAGAAAV